jgi:hypothetical protein
MEKIKKKSDDVGVVPADRGAFKRLDRSVLILQRINIPSNQFRKNTPTFS